MFIHLKIQLIVLGLLLANDAMCGGIGTLEPGRWGGAGVQLLVLDNGVKAEFNCAFGVIDEPITVNSNGRFSQTGKYLREPGGPGQLGDKEPEGIPAVFSGEVFESQMTLLIELPGDGRSIGPFTLKLSQKAELEKCL